MRTGKSTNGLIDDLDRQILELLQEDCTTSRSRIGELVGLSGPSVHERIRKLEECGVVRGYHAMLDPRAVGVDVSAFIGVSLQHPVRIEAFEDAVGELRAVQECHHVTGDFTLMLKVRTANTATLEELISRLRSLDGVQRTVTMVVLSTQTERTTVDLDPPEEPAGPRRRSPARVRASR